jgi:hypothetical protein
MRRNLVARTGKFVRPELLQLLAQGENILLQTVNLLLLAKHGVVEHLEEVLRKAHLGLEFVQSGFHDSFQVQVRSGRGMIPMPRGTGATQAPVEYNAKDYICAFDFLPGAAGGT